MKSRDLLIIGSGGHARVVAETACAEGWRVLGFVDNTHVLGELINDMQVLGDDELWRSEDYHINGQIIVALGDQLLRRSLSLEVLEKYGQLATVVHPSAVISQTAKLGSGVVVNANVVINANVKLGQFCILNTACVIEHDCDLGDGVQVGPSAVLAGNVKCAEDAFIGAGATIIPNVKIGARAVIGAGASIIEDVPADTTVVGVPGKLNL